MSLTRWLSSHLVLVLVVYKSRSHGRADILKGDSGHEAIPDISAKVRIVARHFGTRKPKSAKVKIGAEKK